MDDSGSDGKPNCNALPHTSNDKAASAMCINVDDVAFIDAVSDPEDYALDNLTIIPSENLPNNDKSEGRGLVILDNEGEDESAAFIPEAKSSNTMHTATIVANSVNSAKFSSIPNGTDLQHLSRHSSTGSVTVPVLSIPPQQEPPDGGLQAWLVMFASFFCNGILFGTINSSGMLFDKLKMDLEEQGVEDPASKVALCVSLTIGMTFLMSLVSGVLTDKLGVRTTTFIGGAIATLGMFLSSLVYEQIHYLTLTYGLLLGVGGSLAYTPSLVILGHYFRRHMGIVNGFVTAGSSMFTILMPMLYHVLLSRYGLKVLFQVLAALMAMLIVCAFIFKPRLAVLPPESSTRYRSVSCLKICREQLSQIINFDIWHNKRYVIWSLCIPLALFGYFVPYVHLVSYTKSLLGEDVQAQVLVQCIGATSGIGRILFGYIADKPWVDRILLQQVSFFCIGTFTMLLTAWANYWFFMVLALGMGLFDGCFISLLGPVAFDVVGPTGAPQAIGSLLAMCAVPLTFGPWFAGFLEDTLGSYFIPFLVAGLPPIIGSLAMFSIRCVALPPQGAPGSPVREVTGQQNNKQQLCYSNSNSGTAADHLQALTVVVENGCSSSGGGVQHRQLDGVSRLDSSM